MLPIAAVAATPAELMHRVVAEAVCVMVVILIAAEAALIYKRMKIIAALVKLYAEG
jgi:hypothetical protein